MFVSRFVGVLGQRRPRVVPRTSPGTHQGKLFTKIVSKTITNGSRFAPQPLAKPHCPEDVLVSKRYERKLKNMLRKAIISLMFR